MRCIIHHNPIPYRILFPTPFGEAALLYTEKPFLIRQVVLPRQNESDNTEPAKQIKWGTSKVNSNAGILVQLIMDYFHGRFTDKTWPAPPWKWMDLEDFTPLQQLAFKTAAGIPFGQTRSYQWIAASIGHVGAARFVGTTMAHNPYPILIPCHRVIRSDGTPGHFGGGTDLKRKMIDLEAGCGLESGYE